jgi:hypothetical protein
VHTVRVSYVRCSARSSQVFVAAIDGAAMAKCIMCERPVVHDPHVLSNGQLVHDACRYAAFTPRVRPKIIRPRGDSSPAVASKK